LITNAISSTPWITRLKTQEWKEIGFHGIKKISFSPRGDVLICHLQSDGKLPTTVLGISPLATRIEG
jgi:hypothetical protein